MVICLLILYKDEFMYLKKCICVFILLINGEYDFLIKDKNYFKLEVYFLNVMKKIFEYLGYVLYIEELEVFMNYYLNFLKSVL